MATPTKSKKPPRHAPSGEIAVRTERRTQLLDVTAAVGKMVHDSGVRSGICYIYVPHTTAGVIINENADPAVAAVGSSVGGTTLCATASL